MSRLNGKLTLGFLLLGAVLSLAWAPPAAAASIPTMTRAEIIARAESALGTAYTWGGESWVPDTASGAGPDCSGLVLKCWEVPRQLLYQEEDGVNASITPRYTTGEFKYNSGPWYSLTSRSSLAAGDIMVKHQNGGGHVVLYAEGDAWGYPIVYEAPYTGATVRRASRYLSQEYQPRRRESLSSSGILLDNPTAKSTGGTAVGGNWTPSTSVAGYHGFDYQVHAASTTRAWARWTPRLPASGYYYVYLRWTAWPNRATNAKVTINTAWGQQVKYVNQRINGGSWYSLGRYYMKAGYATGAGSVAVHATGANGYVVADAALFVPAQ
ncbi:MAG: hypothetical protein GXX83_10180 [Gaiellales bacterium]|nr:hypothetical protein [Gaiellales bacterium]